MPDKVKWQWKAGGKAMSCALVFLVICQFAAGKNCVFATDFLGFINAGIAVVIMYFPWLIIIALVAGLSASFPRYVANVALEVALTTVAFAAFCILQSRERLEWIAPFFLMVSFGCLTRLVPASFGKALLVFIALGLIGGTILYLQAQSVHSCYP